MATGTLASLKHVVRLKDPHPAQQRVLDAAQRFNVVCCGRRWGKTTLAEDRLIHPALAGYPTGYFAPSYKMLLETWREMRLILREVTSRARDDEHRIELYGGGVVEMWSMTDPDAGRGRKYKRAVVDEAAMVEGLMYRWQQAIRPTLTDYQGDGYFFSTPRGLQDFHALYQLGGTQDWAAFRMPTSTNPFIPRDELDAARRDLGPMAYAQEYEADFLALGDAAFPQVTQETHVVSTDYDKIARWRRVAGHDYGYGSPAAQLWWAIDPEGGAIAYREWSGRKLQVDEVAQAILYRQGDEQVITYADPSLFRMSGKAYLTTEMIADLAAAGKQDLTLGRQYAEAGLHMVPANNNRVPGFLRLQTLFGPRPSDGVPYLRFMDCCPDAFATFQHIQLNPDKGGNDVLTDFPVSDPVWRRDEYYDCTRYAIMSIPTSAVAPIQEPIRPRTYATVW